MAAKVALSAAMAGSTAAIIGAWSIHDGRTVTHAEILFSRERQKSLNLAKDGATVIHNVLSETEVALWRERVLEATTPESKGAKISAIGRSHFVLRSGHPYWDDLLALSASDQLSNAAKAYFSPHDGAYRISQQQLLDAAPNSNHQIWHRDNSERGLTAIIALDDIGSNGPTELLLGSHVSFWAAARGRAPLLGTIRAGDAIVYDARVFHRGRGFAEGPRRPVLVCRWDSYASPPPGVGAVGTLLQRGSASLLSLALFCQSPLSGGGV
jgi:hypothetical protein